MPIQITHSSCTSSSLLVWYMQWVENNHIQGFHASWKVLEFLFQNFQDLKSPGKLLWSWKVLEIYLQGTKKSWNLLGDDVDGISSLQIDMFLQTKVARIVGSKCSFWDAGMPKMPSGPGLHPIPHWESLQRSPRPPSCCWSLYLNIACLCQGSGKILLGPGKVLEFYVTKRGEPC